MSILIDEKTPRHRSGIHRRQGDLPRQGIHRIRNQRRRWSDAGEGRDAPPRPSRLQHREGSRAGDRRHGQYRVRACRLLCRFHHGGSRRGHPPRRDDHRRDSGAGHDDGQALSLALSQGTPDHADRAQLRRSHQRRQGDARHHARTHLFPWLRGAGDAVRHARLRSRVPDECAGHRADRRASGSGATRSTAVHSSTC